VGAGRGHALIRLALVLVAALVGVGSLHAARPHPRKHVGPNAIVRENRLPGTDAWLAQLASPDALDGYASVVSVRPGGVVPLHVSSAAPYAVRVYRLGWYRGLGGRLVTCVPRGCASTEPAHAFATPQPDPSTGYLDAGWPVTDTVHVGRTWTSGYYLAEPQLADGTVARIPFVVLAPLRAKPTPMLVQASVNTWEAYNRWGGQSLYTNQTGVGDNHVSFDRPFYFKDQGPLDWEIYLVRFLERNGLDASYTTDVDTDARPAELLRHRLDVVAGHDEYWTARIRNAYDAALAHRVDLAFMGANVGYWQIRYENLRRTIVEYRIASTDPEPNPALKTTTFDNLGRPGCKLGGVEYTGGVDESVGRISRDYTVVDASLSDPWFAGTGFAPGAVLPGLVGYEWDRVVPGCEPPRLTVFFHYPGSASDGNQPADAVRWIAPSGATVFSAGSLQFNWGLDRFRARRDDPRLQRFVLNAFHAMLRR
jgi:hypothetical protein